MALLENIEPSQEIAFVLFLYDLSCIFFVVQC